MSKTILAAAIGAVLSTGALAQGAPNLSHNGSGMRLDVVGEKVTIRYAQPRPGLAEAGVYPGAVLFTGTFQGDVIVGQAVAFKARCSPAVYNVGGRIEAGRFVLVGLGPHRQGCAVKDYLANSPHSRLAFEVTDQDTVAMLANQADPTRTRTASEMLSVLRPGANRKPSPVAMQESAPAPVPVPTPHVQAQAQTPAPAPVPFVPVAPLPRAETVTPSAPPSPRVAEVPVPTPPAPAPIELRTSEAAPPAPVSPTPPVAVAPAPQPKAKPKLDADL